MERLAGDMSEDLVQGIARNLEAVLNTKRGYGSVVEVFGLGEHDVFRESKSRMDTLLGEMLDQIRRYEPRLLNVALVFAGRESSNWALFRVTGVTREGVPLAFRLRWHVILRNVMVSAEPGASR